MKHILPILMCFGTPAYADDKADLIALIESAGLYEYKDERRAVEIDGCEMTTYRWMDRPDRGWVLWTSFRFDMADAELDRDTRFVGKKHAYAKIDDGPPEIGIAIYSFKMQHGTTARHEKPFLRAPKGDVGPSPRGDGTTHYYERRDDMIITMFGPELEQKAITFTTSYDAYVAAYCRFSS